MTKQLYERECTDNILRLPEVRMVTGLSRSSIYAMEGSNLFPRRLKLGMRSVGWLESEVRAWVALRAERRRPLPTTVPKTSSSAN